MVRSEKPKSEKRNFTVEVYASKVIRDVKEELFEKASASEEDNERRDAWVSGYCQATGYAMKAILRHLPEQSQRELIERMNDGKK